MERILKQAKLEDIEILSGGSEQRIATSNFMDRVESEVFSNLAEEVRKLDAKLRDLERKADARN